MDSQKNTIFTAKAKSGNGLLNHYKKLNTLDDEQIAYVKARTDPYHDIPIHNLTGIPDGVPGKVLVYDITRFKTYTQADFGGLVPAENWNLAVMTFPVVDLIPMKAYNMRNNALTDLGVASYAGISPSVVFASCPSNPDFINGANRCDAATMALPPGATSGGCKIIGMAIEVFDTTAELYKQGSFVGNIINLNGLNQATFNYFPDGETLSNHATGTFYSIPHFPKTQADLMLMPDCVTHEAKDGCYAVVRLIDRPDIAAPQPAGLLLCTPGLECDSDVRTALGTPFTELPTPVFSPWQISGSHLYAPMHQTVLMFNGLHPSASLTVRTKYFYQIYPDIYDAETVSLSKPPPSMNLKVIQLAQAILHELPPCVKFSENETGEWFSRVLSTIMDIAPTILGAIPHPIAQAAAVGANAVKHLTQKNVTPDEKENRIKKLEEELRELRRRQIEEDRNYQKRMKLRKEAASVRSKSVPPVVEIKHKKTKKLQN